MLKAPENPLVLFSLEVLCQDALKILAEDKRRLVIRVELRLQCCKVSASSPSAFVLLFSFLDCDGPTSVED